MKIALSTLYSLMRTSPARDALMEALAEHERGRLASCIRSLSTWDEPDADGWRITGRIASHAHDAIRNLRELAYRRGESKAIYIPEHE